MDYLPSLTLDTHRAVRWIDLLLSARHPWALPQDQDAINPCEE